MVIEVDRNSSLIKGVIDVDNIFYYLSLITVPPVFVVLLVIFLPLAFTCYYLQKKGYTFLSKVDTWVFHVAKYIFKFLKTDKSKRSPRFIVCGYIAPVIYTYFLLYVLVIVSVYSLTLFWEVAFKTNIKYVPCNSTADDDSSLDCAEITIQIGDGIGAALACLLFSIFLLAVETRLLLTCSGGKINCRNRFGCNKTFYIFRIVTLISCQVILPIVSRLLFYAFLFDVNFGVSEDEGAAIDENGITYLAVIVDTLSIGLLMPWCLFKKINSQSSDAVVINDNNPNYQCNNIVTQV